MAKPIKDVLAQLIIRRGYGREIDHEEMEQVWELIVGQNMAENSKPKQPYRGTVEVIVKNSTVLQELSFKKHSLLKEFQEKMPEKTIRDLRFRIGSF